MKDLSSDYNTTHLVIYISTNTMQGKLTLHVTGSDILLICKMLPVS